MACVVPVTETVCCERCTAPAGARAELHGTRADISHPKVACEHLRLSCVCLSSVSRLRLCARARSVESVYSQTMQYIDSQLLLSILLIIIITTSPNSR